MNFIAKISPILFAIVLLLGSLPAKAECSRGDVQAIFHAAPVFSSQRARGIESHMVEQGVGPIGGPCQYRLFIGEPLGSEVPPPIQTFTAGQSFLGGVVLYWDYQNVGITRKQAVEDIELVDAHVYLMPTDDEWNYDLDELFEHEATLSSTTIRGFVHYVLGPMVFRQKGVIEELPAGQYVSLYTYNYPGNPSLQALHPDDPDWVSFFEPFESTSVVFLDIVP